MDRAMKSGVGTASITLDNGITIAALVVVNAIGDVVDPNTNAVVAGVRTIDGSSLLDARELLRDNAATGRSGENTTIAVVATNAAFSKAEVNKIAQMAHDGLARTIYPVHTPFDGDAVFGLATGTHQESATVLVVGALAADVLAEAVLRAVRAANGIPGLPAAADLPGRSR
jgi:L-aminopeptidase/D-esterase-like protein